MSEQEVNAAEYYRLMALDEGRRADDLEARVDALAEVAAAAKAFHEKLWQPWRSGRTSAIFADSVVIAYGRLRRALAAWDQAQK